jgi:23S rRNA (guanosine2251-2'-O)-methyltransferase
LVKRREPESQQFVYGSHAVRHALDSAPECALELWVQSATAPAALSEIQELARVAGLTVQVVPRKTLDRLAASVHHQGVVLRRRVPAALEEDQLPVLLGAGKADPFVLVLDGVQDPHNLGACLRTADAAGVNAVVIPMRRSAGLTPTVTKVASGAAESVALVQARNLARILTDLKHRGLRLIGTASEAPVRLFDADLKGPIALVMGGEEGGLRRLTREHCDLLVHIPMAGRVESLNVSVATGVCLYEAVRQRSPAGCEQS